MFFFFFGGGGGGLGGMGGIVIIFYMKEIVHVHVLFLYFSFAYICTWMTKCFRKGDQHLKERICS